MSANNQVLVLSRNNKFLGYDVCADGEINYDELYKKDTPKFEADNLLEAIKMAQTYCQENNVEYNYYFVGY